MSVFKDIQRAGFRAGVKLKSGLTKANARSVYLAQNFADSSNRSLNFRQRLGGAILQGIEQETLGNMGLVGSILQQKREGYGSGLVQSATQLVQNRVFGNLGTFGLVLSATFSPFKESDVKVAQPVIITPENIIEVVTRKHAEYDKNIKEIEAAHNRLSKQFYKRITDQGMAIKDMDARLNKGGAALQKGMNTQVDNLTKKLSSTLNHIDNRFVTVESELARLKSNVVDMNTRLSKKSMNDNTPTGGSGDGAGAKNDSNVISFAAEAAKATAAAIAARGALATLPAAARAVGMRVLAAAGPHGIVAAASIVAVVAIYNSMKGGPTADAAKIKPTDSNKPGGLKELEDANKNNQSSKNLDKIDLKVSDFSIYAKEYINIETDKNLELKASKIILNADVVEFKTSRIIGLDPKSQRNLVQKASYGPDNDLGQPGTAAPDPGRGNQGSSPGTNQGGGSVASDGGSGPSGGPTTRQSASPITGQDNGAYGANSSAGSMFGIERARGGGGSGGPQSYGPGTTYTADNKGSKKISQGDLKGLLVSELEKSKLSGFKPKDGGAYGIDGSPESYANLFMGMAKNESAYDKKKGTFNSTDTYREKNGTISEGLFSLSKHDTHAYPALAKKLGIVDAQGRVRNMTQAEIFDPELNARFAVGVLEHNIQKHGNIRGGAGATFGPVARGKVTGRDAAEFAGVEATGISRGGGDTAQGRLFFDENKPYTKAEHDELLKKHGPNISVQGFEHKYDEGRGGPTGDKWTKDERERIEARAKARGMSFDDYRSKNEGWREDVRANHLAHDKGGGKTYDIDNLQTPQEAIDHLNWMKENGVKSKLTLKNLNEDQMKQVFKEFPEYKRYVAGSINEYGTYNHETTLQDTLKEAGLPQGQTSNDPSATHAYKSAGGRMEGTPVALGQSYGFNSAQIYNGSPKKEETLAGNLVNQKQADVAATRKLPISYKLNRALNYAANKTGVQVEVTSGGQAYLGQKGPRTGSTRHDGGMAADLKLYVEEDGKKRYLDFENKKDRPYFEEFAKHSRAAGATGIGAGTGYMGSKTMHVGFGKEATWGGADWLPGAFKDGQKIAKTAPPDLSAQPNAVTALTPEAMLKEREAAIMNSPLLKGKSKGPDGAFRVDVPPTSNIPGITMGETPPGINMVPRPDALAQAREITPPPPAMAQPAPPVASEDRVASRVDPPEPGGTKPADPPDKPTHNPEKQSATPEGNGYGNEEIET